jgi:drug/metabolite transporter (DMT)-like permease
VPAALAAVLAVGANITMLLAIVVLRERVTRWQSAGMALALVSVAMIAAG